MRWRAGLTSVLIAVALLFAWAPAAPAQEAPLRGVFQNAVYGGLTGALVGGAVLALDHGHDPETVLYGAAVGVIAGTLYGLVTAPRPFASLERGRWRFAVPVPGPSLGVDAGGRIAFGVGAELVRARF